MEAVKEKCDFLPKHSFAIQITFQGVDIFCIVNYDARNVTEAEREAKRLSDSLERILQLKMSTVSVTQWEA